MKVYVSGPPVDQLSNKSLPETVYEIIQKASKDLFEVDLPIRTESLSKLPPSEFFAAISRRIDSADGVITLLIPDDQSTPVEAATAAQSGKIQSIVMTFDGPRLVVGLPNVVDVVKLDKTDLAAQINSVVSQLAIRLNPRSNPRGRSAQTLRGTARADWPQLGARTVRASLRRAPPLLWSARHSALRAEMRSRSSAG